MENYVGSDHFVVDDLLDFPNDDGLASDGMLDASMGAVSIESSSVSTVADSFNSSFSMNEPPNLSGSTTFVDPHFSSDLCVPYDDVAELEWLSNFVEESFSSEDLQNMQMISCVRAPRSDEQVSQIRIDELRNNTIFTSDVSVPGKARSKRSRIPPGNWTSRLLAVSPPMIKPPQQLSLESNFHPATGKKTVTTPKLKDSSEISGSDGRRCLHCQTDKTPQWRTGPMGPKTLCNACGVRYKSGRLVPEYRPAASPTFVLTKHSNSHRKVMELRRQKEVQKAQHHHQQHFMNHQSTMMYDVSNSDDYLIHHHMGPDFRQLI